MKLPLIRRILAGLLLAVFAALPAVSADTVWLDPVRQAYFSDRPITESADVIRLEAPERAEDPAVVPVSITAGFPQTADRYIKTITVLIDKNPVPLAGRFTFGPRSGRADLALRIRVNEYSPVRAIAETNDGQLYMASRFVKASGGCSAPVGADLEAAMSRLGTMKFKTRASDQPDEPVLAQLLVSHPNITGLQMDQLTRLYRPAHFVREITVRFNGEPVLVAETDISISENPSFRFYFVPDQPGELTAEVVDSQDQHFTSRHPITPAAGVPPS